MRRHNRKSSKLVLSRRFRCSPFHDVASWIKKKETEKKSTGTREIGRKCPARFRRTLASRVGSNNQIAILCVPPITSAPLDRPVEGRRLHKIRPARRGRAGDPRAEWHHTEGLVRADHRQVRQQSQQQQQGDTTVGRLSRTASHAAFRRADPPSDRPLQVHSTVATIQVPTRLYSLYPRIFTISLTLRLCSVSFSLSASVYPHTASVGECCAERFVAVVNAVPMFWIRSSISDVRVSNTAADRPRRSFSRFSFFSLLFLYVDFPDNSLAA